MRITIFGATGKTGMLLVQQACAAGHEVTAVVRDPKRLTVAGTERLHIITADVMDAVAIMPAVDDADAVVSAIGPRGIGPTSVSGDSARSIIEAMEKCGSRRLITISGSVVDDTGNGFLMRNVAKRLARATFLRNVCADMRLAEEAIHASDLDWTIVRPPRLTDKAAAGAYRAELDRNVAHSVTLARADLAAYVVDHLVDPATIRRHVFVAN